MNERLEKSMQRAVKEKNGQYICRIILQHGKSESTQARASMTDKGLNPHSHPTIPPSPFFCLIGHRDKKVSEVIIG